jgi:pimeloyl-ACP methyl ester carboxylesterase
MRYILLGLAFAASAVLYTDTAHAASSRLFLYEEVIRVEIDENGEEYEVYDTITTTVEDGGSYPVDLDYIYQLGMESDAEIDRVPPPQHIVSFKGKLYRTDDSGERHHVADLFGPDGEWEHVWGTAGNYELDVYAWDEPVPILSEVPWWKRMITLVDFLPLVYADSHETFVETIKFRITDVNAPAACCSNVLFIPGIKGSVLKSGSDSLWPPTLIQTFNGGISSLALTPEGESKNPVVVNGILETFYGVPVYAPFVSFMDSLVNDGTIANWEAFPYDWRFTAEKNISDGIKTENGIVDVITELEELATSSDTGHVTIIAHSMGGLFGKALIKTLEEQGKENLIDSFVMVGSPQLGTPQAIAGILHGGGESIGLGFIVNPGTSRTIAQNMQSAHDLLPSPKYFDAVTDPVITFNQSAEFTAPWRQQWGNTIDGYGEFKAFLTGEGVSRTDPPPDNLRVPEVLRADLVDNSADLHTEYDEYVFPDHIRVVQIAGWGLPTVKGVEYRNEHFYPSYRVVNTREGDSVVVYPSAVSSIADETYFFNAFEYNEQFGSNSEHKDLLTTLPIQQVLKFIIMNEGVDSIDLVTSTKPVPSEIEAQLLVSAHSPVILGVSDGSSNFTGIDPNQDLSAEFLFVKEEIPGSSFLAIGESQQIFLPKEGVYNFVYQGIGVGSTTVEIAVFENDTATPVAEYTDIPTTDATTATFEINSETPENTVIQIDENNDGVVDEVVQPDSSTPPELSLEELVILLKTKINELHLQESFKKKLLRFVSAFEKTLKVKKPFLRKLLSHGALRVIQVEIEHLTKRQKLSAGQAAELLEIIAKIKEKI